MAEVGDGGIIGKSFSEYQEELESIYRSVFGADLSFESSTPQAQMIGILSQSYVEIDEQIVATGGAFDLDLAGGNNLDALLSLVGVERVLASYSSGEVTFYGEFGTDIESGRRVAHEDSGAEFEVITTDRIDQLGTIAVVAGGDNFTSVPTVVIPPPNETNGTQATATAVLDGDSIGSIAIDESGSGYTIHPVNVTLSGGGGGTGASLEATGKTTTDVRAILPGPIEAEADTLTRVVVESTTITSVTNEDAVTPGTNLETDSAYRTRGRTQIGRNALGTKVAIESAVLAVDDVTHVRVEENAQDSEQDVDGVSIRARGVLVVVDGGTDAAVAAAIAQSKAAGVPTGRPDGAMDPANESETVDGTDIRFVRVAEVPLAVTVTLTIRSDFPTTGLADMENAIIDYVAGADVGDGVNDGAIYGAVYSAVPSGHLTTNVTVARKTPGIGVTVGVTDSDVKLHELLVLDRGDIDFTVS